MNALEVFFHRTTADKVLLGRLAYKQGLAYLELAREFISLGINISPVKLTLDSRLQASQRTPFNGLHGVFADSLPDGWGLLLMDRYFRQYKLQHPKFTLETITPLNRLAYMGNRTMGALSYQPVFDGGQKQQDEQALSLTVLASQSLQIYRGKATEVSQQLRLLGGSPGGARPKATIGLNGDHAIGDSGEDLPENFEHWLVKFPTGIDEDAQAEGAVEYVYSLMARNAGIGFPATRLIETQQSPGYFACRRFDRGEDKTRVHLHSFAGLVNADFRVPDSDYELLIKATSHITRSHIELCEVLRRMIFNILSGNRDDHTKNFSFLMSQQGQWNLSPAYDVTYNSGINGHHAMSVMGADYKISPDAVQAIADLIPLSKTEVKLMTQEIIAALALWERLAKMHNVPSRLSREIGSYMATEIGRFK